MNEPLCDTFLTGKKIEKFLLESGKANIDGHRLAKVEAKIASESEGFTATLLRVSLTWTPNDWTDLSLPRKLIIKVIGNTKIQKHFNHESDPEFTKQAANDVKESHDIECAVYELKGLQDVVPMPKCFAAVKNRGKHPGILILDDLSDSATVMPAHTMGFGLNEKQTDQVLQALTSAQAWSLNTNENWKKSIFPAEDTPVLISNVELQRRCFEDSKLAYPEVFQGIDDEKLLNEVSDEKYFEIYGGNSQKKYNLPLVLVHGDIHFMNLVLEKNKNGDAGDRLVALIDWAFAHQGCGVEDLIKLFKKCLSTEVRRKRKEELLERYVKLFNEKIVSKENEISLKNVKKAFQDMFVFKGILTACAMSLIDSYVSRMENVPKEERKAMKKRMEDDAAALFQDTREILGW